MAQTKNGLPHVAFIGPTSSVHVLKLAKSLAAEGLKISVISGDNYEITEKAGDVSFYFFKSHQNFFSKIKQVHSILKQIQPDIVHSHFVNHGGYMGFCIGFHPHIVSAWGCDVLNIPHNSLFHRIFIPLTLRSADYILPVSNELNVKIHELTYSDKNTEVLSWGINSELFRPENRDSNFRIQYQIPESTFFILSPRGIQPVYNHEIILKAFSKFITKYPESLLGMIRFGIIDDSYYRSIINLIHELKLNSKIIWFDSFTTEKMPFLYNCADVTISLAQSDGTPMTVQEVMSCGQIAIASNLETMKEWIVPDKTGFISECSEDDLVKQITKVKFEKTDDLKQIGINARKKILKDANAQNNIKRFIEIYKSALRNRVPQISYQQTLKNIYFPCEIHK